MKTFIKILLVIIALVAVYFYAYRPMAVEAPLDNTPIPVENISPRPEENIGSGPALSSNGRACFAYEQAATQEAPYEVKEFLDVTLSGSTVTGRKTGTQAGPDMTNGYQGSILGTKNAETLTLTYSYVIEGSAQKEQEEYVVEGLRLIKKRWPLVERNGILVPNKSAAQVGQQEYKPVECSTIPTV